MLGRSDSLRTHKLQERERGRGQWREEQGEVGKLSEERESLSLSLSFSVSHSYRLLVTPSSLLLWVFSAYLCWRLAGGVLAVYRLPVGM